MARRCASSPARWAAAWAAALALLCGCQARPDGGADSAGVQAALERRIGVDAADERLGDVLAGLLDDAEIPLVNRAEHRWPAKYRSDDSVTLRLSDVRLESALRWLLLPRGLDFVVEEGPEPGLRIVGRDETGEFVARTYPVADILALDGGWCDEGALAAAIAALVAPGAWPPTTGEGYVQVMPGALAIAGPPEVHRRTERLLADIRRAADPQGFAPASTPSAEPSPTEQRIAAALERPVDLELIDATIDDLAEWLRGQGLNVVVDQSAIGNWDMGRAARFRGVPLQRALDLLLADSLCDWQFRDEALWLHSGFDPSFDIETRVHATADLRMERGEFVPTRKWIETAWFDGEDLIALVQEIVEPSAWSNILDERGLIVEVPGGLAVTHSHHVHGRLDAFLRELRTALDPYRTGTHPAASAAYLRLEEVLDSPVSIAWAEQPLRRELWTLLQDFPSVVLKAEVLLDWLDGVGQREKETFPLRVQDILLRAALGLVLEPHGLAFQNVGGVLVVGEAGDPALEYRCYRIAGDALGQAAEIVKTHAAAYSWSDVGGTAQIAEFPGGLAVAQTPDAHAAVQSLLADAGFLPRDSATAELAEPEHVRRIRAALAEPVTMDVRDKPLAEVLAELAARHGIQALYEDGTPPAVRLTGRAAGVPLGDALRRMLLPHKLDWVVRHEVLLIVGESREAWLLTTRTYPYLGQPALAGEMLRRFVGPESWGNSPGMGACTELPHALLVWQTESLHADAARLLETLRPPPGDDAESVAERSRVDALDRALREGALESIDLAAALADPSPRVRLLGLLAMQEYGPLEVGPPVGEGADPDSAPAGEALQSLLRAPEREVRLAAVSAIRWRHDELDLAAPILIDLYRQEWDPDQREAILSALAALGPAGTLAWAELLKEDALTAERALARLRYLGPEAVAAVPALSDFLRRCDESFHVPLCETLAAIGPAAEEAVPALVELIEADVPRRDAVKAACKALAAIRARPEVSIAALILVAEGDKYRDSPYVRAEAYQALSAFPDQVETIVPVLNRALKDPNKAVANAAASSLAPIQLIGGLSEPKEE